MTARFRLHEIKDELKRLYVDENKILSDVMFQVEQDHGIVASKPIYERVLRELGLRKNKKGDCWKWVDYRIQKRKLQGKDSRLVINGVSVQQDKIRKEIARHVTLSEQLVQTIASSPQTPSGYLVDTQPAFIPDQSSGTDTALTAGTQSPRHDGATSINGSIDALSAFPPGQASGATTVPIAGARSFTHHGSPSTYSRTGHRELIAKIMQDCDCFNSLWAREGITRTPEQIIATYNDIAASIVTGIRNSGTIQTTGDTCSAVGFGLLRSAYINDKRHLIEMSKDDEDVDGDIFRTVMFLASFMGATDVLEARFSLRRRIFPYGWLSVCGDYVDIRDLNGLTCLHVAATNNHAATVALLLHRGAEVDSESVDGNTAWTMICEREDCEHVSTLLLQAGANPDHIVQDRLGRVIISPLHKVAAKGHLNTVRLLLTRGTNPSVKSSIGWCPLHEAVSKGHLPVVKELVQAGAIIDEPIGCFASPLGLTDQRKDRAEIRQYLLHALNHTDYYVTLRHGPWFNKTMREYVTAGRPERFRAETNASFAGQEQPPDDFDMLSWTVGSLEIEDFPDFSTPFVQHSSATASNEFDVIDTVTSPWSPLKITQPRTADPVQLVSSVEKKGYPLHTHMDAVDSLRHMASQSSAVDRCSARVQTAIVSPSSAMSGLSLLSWIHFPLKSPQGFSFTHSSAQSGRSAIESTHVPCRYELVSPGPASMQP